MRQLVPDEYCRGHHSRIIYIKVFLQYITYYTVIRLQDLQKVILTIVLYFDVDKDKDNVIVLGRMIYWPLAY